MKTSIKRKDNCPDYEVEWLRTSRSDIRSTSASTARLTTHSMSVARHRAIAPSEGRSSVQRTSQVRTSTVADHYPPLASSPDTLQGSLHSPHWLRSNAYAVHESSSMVQGPNNVPLSQHLSLSAAHSAAQACPESRILPRVDCPQGALGPTAPYPAAHAQARTRFRLRAPTRVGGARPH